MMQTFTPCTNHDTLNDLEAECTRQAANEHAARLVLSEVVMRRIKADYRLRLELEKLPRRKQA